MYYLSFLFASYIIYDLSLLQQIRKLILKQKLAIMKKLIVLGKKSKGTKDFTLKAENIHGFNIECYRKGKAVHLFNIREIVWMNKGWNVMLDPMLKEPFEFMAFDEIHIKLAVEDHRKEQQTFHTT